MKKELAQMVTAKAYKEKYMRGISCIKNLIQAYEVQCRQKDGSTPIQMVDYRIKAPESIADKLERKGYGVSFVNAEQYLSDLAGIRVVCFSKEDVYAMDHFLCNCEEITIVKRKDYISKPKANGYKSIHLIAELDNPEKIRVEIQIRTQDMHCWAEADHRRVYKKLTK